VVLHTDRRGEPADYRSIEVAAIGAGGEKIRLLMTAPNVVLRTRNIAILHDTPSIESGGEGEVLRKAAPAISETKVRHGGPVGTVASGVIECMDVDDCPTDSRRQACARRVNESCGHSRVSMGYGFPAISRPETRLEMSTLTNAVGRRGR